MENCAPGVAFLADLGDFSQGLRSDAQLGPQGQAGQVDAFGGQVFREISRPDVQSGGLHLPDALHGQQADLPVPWSGVGVVAQAVFGHEFTLLNVLFALAFLGAGADRNDFSHEMVSFSVIAGPLRLGELMSAIPGVRFPTV